MPNPKYQIDYNEFMTWFEKTYPKLFDEYKGRIILAKDETGLQIDKSGLDQKAYDTLFDIENEFYSLKQK